MSFTSMLQEADVRRWVGSASFERGRRYFQQRAIHQGRRLGATLKARCLGSRPMPYEVEATLAEEDRIASADCSCPVGDGGHCKHVAALLLTWLDDPEAFVVLEDLETALGQRTQEQLIVLIRSMVARYPDLELLIAQPTVDPASGEAVNTNFIRKQVDSALAGAGYDYEWGHAYNAYQALEDVVQTGDVYAAQHDWRNAAAVYRTAAEGILDRYEELYDEEGDVAMVVNACVEKLGPCLAGTDDPAERKVILRTLFDVYAWDVAYGGIGIGDDAPGLILEFATPEERRQVAGWVREKILRGDSTWSTGWRNEVYGGFLLDLEADILDDATFLRICRETGRLDDLVERLLTLHRAEEALAEARKADDYPLLRVADHFVRHGHGAAIRDLIRERQHGSKDARFTEWLHTYAADHGDWESAVSLGEVLFWARPSVSGYEAVRTAAEALDRWETVRTALLGRLRHEEQYSTLTEIYLAEHDVARALETVHLQPTRATGFAWYGYRPDMRLKIRVAEVAEASHPHDAIDLYLHAALHLIEQRGRGNYAQAAAYLGRIKTLYLGLSKPETWHQLIAEVRDSNKRLSALKDELHKAGL